MPLPWAQRQELVQRLNTAYGAGLLSDKTFAHRLEALLSDSLIDPRRLVGDLQLRREHAPLTKVRHWMWQLSQRRSKPSEILALDWNGSTTELLIGRAHDCDVLLDGSNVSRLHARLSFRDGRWILRDLASTNGTVVNGTKVGRCELRPGDELVIGSHRLRVD